MATTVSKVTVADGLRLPLHVSGGGRPLLIVPGVANDPALTWELARPHFDSRVTFAVLHRRGALGDPLGDLTMEQEFNDVAEVARTLGPEVDVLGHSSGAIYALGAAPMIPNLRKLVLYEPPLEALQNEAHRQRMDRLYEFLRAGDIDGLFNAWWTVYLTMPQEVADMVIDSPMGATLRPLAQYMPREIRAHLTWNIPLESFSTVTAPTLYLVGQENEGGAMFTGWRSLLTGVLPGMTSRQIPGQGHFAPVLDPALFARLVMDFLDE